MSPAKGKESELHAGCEWSLMIPGLFPDMGCVQILSSLCLSSWVAELSQTVTDEHSMDSVMAL